jgi:hypothetical protein
MAKTQVSPDLVVCQAFSFRVQDHSFWLQPPKRISWEQIEWLELGPEGPVFEVVMAKLPTEVNRNKAELSPVTAVKISRARHHCLVDVSGGALGTVGYGRFLFCEARPSMWMFLFLFFMQANPNPCQGSTALMAKLLHQAEEKHTMRKREI